MARVFTPKDGAALLSAVVREATGQEIAIQTINVSNFASIGETVLATGKENVLSALSTVLFREMIAVRPYSARFKSIRVKGRDLFEQRTRKISYYAQDPCASGAWNSDLWTSFADGFTNGQNFDGNGDPQSLKSMWEQRPPKTMEKFFGGMTVYDDSYVVYESQLDVAFRSAADLAKFANGYIQEKMNDIESEKEAFSRAAMLSSMAQLANTAGSMKGSFRNLTKEFNAEFGTNYTTAQLQTTYLKEFLAFFVATVKTDVRRMENRSTLFHDPMTITDNGVKYSILRHTPRDRQHMICYAPFWTKAESYVMPSIFNESYLKLDNFEAVDFWQNELNSSAMNVTPAVLNKSTGYQVQGSNVSIPYVLAYLFDEEACGVDFMLQSAASTPLEARKMYRNVWYHMAENMWADASEKQILYVMSDSDLTVTNTLTKATTDNSASVEFMYTEYSANITPDSGYSITTATVYMGGTDITSTAWTLDDDGVGHVYIPSVTGNIVITVTATS